VTVAEIQAKTSLRQAAISAKAKDGLTEIDDEGEERITNPLAELLEGINQTMANLMGLQQQGQAEIIAQISRPRTRVLQRGPDGRATGAIEV
jgi:hypothetical protein